ncbi:hypothetical protein ACNF36_03005 [Mycoplasma sp. 4463]|uniref:hypothetical protein n=1 Tax=Mycoplasma sp. 4463 TaxID=3400998 RepID=UPI003AABA863
MESKFLNVLNIIGSTPSMVMLANQPTIAKKVDSYGIDNSNDIRIDQENLEKETLELFEKNKEEVSAITDVIVKNYSKKSAKKTVELIDDQKIENLFLKTAQKQIVNWDTKYGQRRILCFLY